MNLIHPKLWTKGCRKVMITKLAPCELQYGKQVKQPWVTCNHMKEVTRGWWWWSLRIVNSKIKMSIEMNIETCKLTKKDKANTKQCEWTSWQKTWVERHSNEEPVGELDSTIVSLCEGIGGLWLYSLHHASSKTSTHPTLKYMSLRLINIGLQTALNDPFPSTLVLAQHWQPETTSTPSCYIWKKKCKP
jgi:hypothetical protein